MIGKRQYWTAFALTGAVFMAVTPVTPAAAQQSDGESATSEEIVVTARRREELLQDVPLAVSAFSAEKLDMTGAADLTALTRATPNVTFEVSRGTSSTLTAFIRGVGQQDPLWGFEPGVGLYVDDVYIARPQGAILDIFDVERLEVLRGPQGTLYGRNTIGGAIKYVTRRIGDGTHAQVRSNFGSYSQLDVIGSASHRVNDWLAIGGAAARFYRDGYGKNVLTGADHYDKDVLAGRFTVELTPSDAIFVRLSGDRTEDDSSPKHGHRLLPSRLAGTNYAVLENEYDTRAGAGDENSVVTYGLSLQAEYAVNDALTLKSISAWRAGKTDTIIDFDALPAPDLDVPALYEDEQVSQELQAQLDFGRVSGVVGVYYLNGIATGAFDTVLGTSTNAFFPNGTSVFAAGKVSTLSMSAFADITVDITDRLSVSVGGRYTEDQKTATVFRQNYNGVRTPFFGNASATPVGGPASNFRRDRTDEKFSPRVSVSFEPTDDLTAYASYSQGFKSGGFDPRSNVSATPAAAQAFLFAGFEPETVDSYELGLKGKFFDRLTLNTAYFFADYKDQQVTVQSGVDTNGDGINDNIVSSIFNAGQSEYQGVEVEGSLRVTDALTGTFTLGYIDAQVKEVISNGVNVQTDAISINDFVPQNTPEWTGQVGATYALDLGDQRGAIDFTGNVSYRSEYYIFNTVVNQGFAPGASAAFPQGGPKLDADDATLVDLSAVWNSPSGRFSLGLHGKNLTDERYRVALYNFAYQPATTGIDSAYSAFYGPPRTVTGTLKINF